MCMGSCTIPVMVLVVITLGSFLYLRICRQESSPYGLSIGNRVQVATGTGGVEPPTKEQIEACVPEVRMDKEETCAVCLESIEVDQTARKLQCNHAFHSECIIGWCTHRSIQAIICPVCRDQQPLNPRREVESEPRVIGAVGGSSSENV